MSRYNPVNLTRYFALLMGIAFVIAGIGGFLPLITASPAENARHLHILASHGKLLGLFPINAIHNLFHLAIGIFGVYSFQSYQSARFFSQVFGISLTILTIFGLVPALNTIFGLMPVYSHDIWLHGLEAIAGLYFGFIVKVSGDVHHEVA